MFFFQKWYSILVYKILNQNKNSKIYVHKLFNKRKVKIKKIQVLYK